MIRRLSGAILFSCFGTFAAAFTSWFINPLFMDQPGPYLFFVLVPLLPLGWWAGPMLPSIRHPWRWALLSVFLFLASVWRPAPDPVDTRLLIVGIDGATWSVVDRTDTPNLDALSTAGLSGTLMAEEPLFSPLLWTTLATGQPTDVHGIKGIRTRTDQAKVPRFWEIAREAGLSVGLYKWLVTWPPPSGEIPGFTVPAWLAGDARTHPSNLSWVKELELSNRSNRKRVEATRPLVWLMADGFFDGLRWSTFWAGIRFGFMELLSPLPPRKKDAFLRRLRLRIDRDVFVHRLHHHNPDVATFTIYVTDALSHTHWASDDGRHVDGAYRLADDILGELVSEVSSQATVLVISDHGFRNGGEGGALHAVVPKIDAFKERLEVRVGAVEIVRVGRQLAITPDVPVSDAVMREAVAEFKYLDGQAVYSVEPFPRRVAWNLKVKNVPPAAEWAATRVLGVPLDELMSPGKAEEGEHDPRGIAVLKGPRIQHGDLGVVDQLDVVPTILSLLELPVAKDLPGQPWVSETKPRVASYEHLAPSKSDKAGETNTERLQQLGYVD